MYPTSLLYLIILLATSSHADSIVTIYENTDSMNTAVEAQANCEADYQSAKRYGLALTTSLDVIFPRDYEVKMHLTQSGIMNEDLGDYGWDCSVSVSIGERLNQYRISSSELIEMGNTQDAQACQAKLDLELRGRKVVSAKIAYGTWGEQSCIAVVYELLPN